MRIDLHQHLLPSALLEALAARESSPRFAGGTLHLPSEPSHQVEPTEHDPAQRLAEADRAGIDLLALSLSPSLGIDLLPPDQAHPLLETWTHCLTGWRGEHPGRFAIWAGTALIEPDLPRLRRHLLLPGVLGLQVPAPALADPDGVARLGEVLALCAELDRPVLVHPGPAVVPDGARLPSWWVPLTAYPAQLAASWFAWHAAGVSEHPDLRIAFVALAGLAPLHHERLVARGGRFRVHPNVFYETSSYGPRGIDALVRVVGVDGVLHGSDEPNARGSDPGLGEAFSHLLLSANPARFLGPSLNEAKEALP